MFIWGYLENIQKLKKYKSSISSLPKITVLNILGEYAHFSLIYVYIKIYIA